MYRDIAELNNYGMTGAACLICTYLHVGSEILHSIPNISSQT